MPFDRERENTSRFPEDYSKGGEVIWCYLGNDPPI